MKPPRVLGTGTRAEKPLVEMSGWRGLSPAILRGVGVVIGREAHRLSCPKIADLGGERRDLRVVREGEEGVVVRASDAIGGGFLS